MRTLLKLISMMIGIVALLATISITLIILCVDPNQFKPFLINQVKKLTSRELIIDGKLSWVFFPTLGLKTGHIALINPPEFAQKIFVEFTSVKVNINWLPLLHKRIESSGIVCEGMQLNLISNTRGNNNWIFPLSFSKENHLPVPVKESMKSTKSLSSLGAGVALSVSTVDIRNAKIYWINEQTKQDMTFYHLNVHAKNITRAYPILLRADFDVSTASRPIETHVLGDILLDLPHQMTRGVLTMDKMQLNHMMLTSIRMPFHFHSNVLTIAPMTAHCYGGSLQAQTTMRLMNPTFPQIETTIGLMNVQIGPLIQDLSEIHRQLTITGTANVNLHLTTAGTKRQELLNQLNGNGRIALTNGTLEGIDLGFYVDTASALMGKQTATSIDTHQTRVGNLTATFNLKKGVIISHDLLLDSRRFEAKGEGALSLVDQTLDYVLQVMIKENNVDILKNMSGVMIPLSITGNLNHPVVQVNTGDWLKKLGEKVLKPQEEKFQKIQEKIKKKLPGKTVELLKNLLGS